MSSPGSPLFDTLFRPTTLTPTSASAAPVRAPGTRTRAGNAMHRTRAALLSGAARAVELSGTKITMAQVAAAGGVAKATLYNHFRTREAVLAALVLDQVDAVVAAQEGKPLEAALTDAAKQISLHPVRRALARLEPAVLAGLGGDRRSRGGLALGPGRGRHRARHSRARRHRDRAALVGVVPRQSGRPHHDRGGRRGAHCGAAAEVAVEARPFGGDER